MKYDETKEHDLATSNSDTDEVFKFMSLGNRDIDALLKSMTANDDFLGLKSVLILAEMDITGDKLWTLYEKCSDKDSDKFYRTIHVLMCETFTDEEIEANLSNPNHAIPFTDEEVDKEYPNFDYCFATACEGWHDYIKKTADVVKPRIHRLMSHRKQYNKLR